MREAKRWRDFVGYVEKYAKSLPSVASSTHYCVCRSLNAKDNLKLFTTVK